MPRFVEAQRLDSGADHQAKRVARARLGKAIDRLADGHLWIGAAAQNGTVEMEFDTIASKGDGRDHLSDQVGWLL